jgi:hypothetical protein
MRKATRHTKRRNRSALLLHTDVRLVGVAWTLVPQQIVKLGPMRLGNAANHLDRQKVGHVPADIEHRQQQALLSAPLNVENVCTSKSTHVVNGFCRQKARHVRVGMQTRRQQQ